jgi:hypothetical protein
MSPVSCKPGDLRGRLRRFVAIEAGLKELTDALDAVEVLLGKFCVSGVNLASRMKGDHLLVCLLEGIEQFEDPLTICDDARPCGDALKRVQAVIEVGSFICVDHSISLVIAGVGA